MRQRPNGAVRVLSRCARCGQSPDLYDVERVIAFLGAPAVRHELAVCRHCRTQSATTPTPMEMAAMALDDTDLIGAMLYVQRWDTAPSRVRRTAEHFLRAERYAADRAAIQAELRERAAARAAAKADEGDCDWLYDEDDDLPF